MKLTYHGTCAAEGWPALFCECGNCARAKKAGGRNIRTRSQADIDGRLLIDFPPDTYMHMLYGKLDLSCIKNIFFTHGHEDHFYPDDLAMRYNPFAHVYNKELLPVHLYGNDRVVRELTRRFENAQQKDIFDIQYIEDFKQYTVDGYIVTPLKANHDRSQESHILIVTDGEKTILYGNDTGYFDDCTWEYLKDSKVRFDFVSLDTTSGVIDCRNGHMGLPTVIEVRDRLVEMGCADGNTRFCLHHFSHNGDAIYDELVPIAAKEGFMVSYDGMEVEI